MSVVGLPQPALRRGPCGSPLEVSVSSLLVESASLDVPGSGVELDDSDSSSLLSDASTVACDELVLAVVVGAVELDGAVVAVVDVLAVDADVVDADVAGRVVVGDDELPAPVALLVVWVTVLIVSELPIVPVAEPSLGWLLQPAIHPSKTTAVRGANDEPRAWHRFGIVDMVTSASRVTAPGCGLPPTRLSPPLHCEFVAACERFRPKLAVGLRG